MNDLREYAKNPNVKAFLKAIRMGEGTSDPKGYFRIVGGGEFVKTNTHPRVRVYIARYRVYSTAAGAYQIIYPTFRGLVRKYGFIDFMPETQDLMAIALIVGVGAITDVLAGNLDLAVKKCSREWASLPGSKAGQRVEKFEDVKAAYITAGGTLA